MKRKPNPQKADRENPTLTKETFARARKARDELPEIFDAASADKMLKPRGRPKSGRARKSISLRLPPETLARWKATGPGWQTGWPKHCRKLSERRASRAAARNAA
jgi:uncharacterized protein (DUF4415 family)